MTTELTINIDNANWQPEPGCWQGDEHSQVKLVLPAAAWLAVQADIALLDGPPGVALIFSTPAGAVPVALPMSLKGVINEVVAVPKHATSVALHPLMQSGRFTIQHIALTPLSGIKRLWRMWRRVALYFTTVPAQKRRQAAITPSLFCYGLSAVYQRIGALKACAVELEYASWLARFDKLSARKIFALKTALQHWHTPDAVAVVVYPTAGTTDDDIASSVNSIKGVYKQHEVSVFVLAKSADADNSVELLKQQCVKFQHIVLLPAGAQLAQAALGWLLAPAYQQYALCYTDHDYISTDGVRAEPQFKPQWNQELSRSAHYVGGMLRLCPAWLLDSGWLDNYMQLGSYGLLLALESRCKPDNTGHIPALLYHLPLGHKCLPDSKVLQQHFNRLAIAAHIEQNAFGLLNIHYQPAEPLPVVSIVVPTRNMLHMLKPCIDSLLHDTTYSNIEVLIVDNQSDDAATLAYMQQVSADPRVNILPFDAPFNYSAINNYAVQQASGELICLLNNDTKVISADWLQQMVGQLQQPGVGAVGARLLFADERVQHAGDAIGVGGCAAHMHFRIAAQSSGYMARAVVSQDLSAVTAACLLTSRALYLQLGGLNEKDLTVAFNDVDYCLKVGEAGHRVVYTPLAQLYHYESVSRGKDDNPQKRRRAAAEADYMRQRWPQLAELDRFYNPNLNALNPDFRLSAAPATEVPW